MPIRIECKCGNKFSAPSKYAGKKVKCPQCSDPVLIPDANNAGATDKPQPSEAKKIPVKCKCGKTFAAKASLLGKTVRCPGCKNPIKIAVNKKSPTSAAKEKAPEDDMFAEIGLGADGPGRRCPECKAEMSEEAILCIQCGYNERLGRKMTVQRPITQEEREQAYQEKTLTGGKKDKKKKK